MIRDEITILIDVKIRCELTREKLPSCSAYSAIAAVLKILVCYAMG